MVEKNFLTFKTMNINKLYTPSPQLIKGRRRFLLKTEDTLPLGYTKLEYLESNGSQYIDTGFKPNQDTRVVMDLIAEATSSTTSGYLCGARESGTSKQFALQTRTGYYAARYGSQEVTVYSGVVTGRQIIDMNKNVYTVNGVSKTLTYETFVSPVSFWIFDINYNGEIPYSPISSMKLYSCKIYDNGVLVRNLVPCINDLGRKGLYDTVNNVFYMILGSQICTISSWENGCVMVTNADKPVASTIDLRLYYYNYYSDDCSSPDVYYKGIPKGEYSSSYSGVCYGDDFWSNTNWYVYFQPKQDDTYIYKHTYSNRVIDIVNLTWSKISTNTWRFRVDKPVGVYFGMCSECESYEIPKGSYYVDVNLRTDGVYVCYAYSYNSSYFVWWN